MLTSGELGKRLGLTAETIRTWSIRYSHHLSASVSHAPPGAARRYSTDDAEALAFVARERAAGESWESIDDRLGAGERVPLPQPESEGEGLEYPPAPLLWGQLQQTRGELGAVTNERDRLREELGAARDRERAAIERAARAEGRLEEREAQSAPQRPPESATGGASVESGESEERRPRSLWERLWGR